MAGVNKAIIVGRLGADPELKYFQNGDAVVNISVATSETWKDKGTGEKMERTEWHRVVAFRRLAEIIGEYLTKGSQIYIEGKLQTRSWEKDGITRYTTEIVANNMQMLDSKGNGGNRNGGGYGGGAPSTAPPSSGSPDDDIPF